MGQGFRNLIVWQKGIVLAKETYALTAKLPKNEQYGLGSQMQRAAVSIPSNLAEGSKRGTKKDFAQFVRIAIGSAAELETQLVIAKEVYPSLRTEVVNSTLREVSAMLVKLLQSTQRIRD